jgi:ribonuclease P protein component
MLSHVCTYALMHVCTAVWRDVMDERFRPAERLRHRADFTKVFKEGRRISSGGLTLWILKDLSERQHSRLGLAIPKAYGNAVHRNRIKRLLREVFRRNKNILPAPVDMVFSARSTSTNPDYQSVEKIVFHLWKSAGSPPTSPKAS